jgi:hypothetical protein
MEPQSNRERPGLLANPVAKYKDAVAKINGGATLSSKIRLALAGLGVSALLIGGVMEPAMAAHSKTKVKVHKTQVIKQRAGNGGNATTGNGGAGGAGGNSGAVASNGGAGAVIPAAPFAGCPAVAFPACVLVVGGPAGSGAGGAGGTGGGSGGATGGAGGGNINGGSNTDATANSGNSVSAG